MILTRILVIRLQYGTRLFDSIGRLGYFGLRTTFRHSGVHASGTLVDDSDGDGDVVNCALGKSEFVAQFVDFWLEDGDNNWKSCVIRRTLTHTHISPLPLS